MKVTKIYCDRCSTEITGPIGYVALNLKDEETDDIYGGNPFEDCEFCEECMLAIHDFVINEHGYTLPFSDVPGSKPEPVELKPVEDSTEKDAQAIAREKISEMLIDAIEDDIDIIEKNIAEEAEAKAIREKKKKAKGGRPRVAVDYGKIIAFVRAGKDTKWIADELKVSTKTVYNYVSRAKKMLNDGTLDVADQKKANNPLEFPNFF